MLSSSSLIPMDPQLFVPPPPTTSPRRHDHSLEAPQEQPQESSQAQESQEDVVSNREDHPRLSPAPPVLSSSSLSSSPPLLQGWLWKRRDVFRYRWRPRWFVLNPHTGTLTYHVVVHTNTNGTILMTEDSSRSHHNNNNNNIGTPPTTATLDDNNNPNNPFATPPRTNTGRSTTVHSPSSASTTTTSTNHNMAASSAQGLLSDLSFQTGAAATTATPNTPGSVGSLPLPSLLPPPRGWFYLWGSNRNSPTVVQVQDALSKPDFYVFTVTVSSSDRTTTIPLQRSYSEIMSPSSSSTLLTPRTSNHRRNPPSAMTPAASGTNPTASSSSSSSSPYPLYLAAPTQALRTEWMQAIQHVIDSGPPSDEGRRCMPPPVPVPSQSLGRVRTQSDSVVQWQSPVPPAPHSSVAFSSSRTRGAGHDDDNNLLLASTNHHNQTQTTSTTTRPISSSSTTSSSVTTTTAQATATTTSTNEWGDGSVARGESTLPPPTTTPSTTPTLTNSTTTRTTRQAASSTVESSSNNVPSDLESSIQATIQTYLPHLRQASLFMTNHHANNNNNNNNTRSKEDWKAVPAVQVSQAAAESSSSSFGSRVTNLQACTKQARPPIVSSDTPAATHSPNSSLTWIATQATVHGMTPVQLVPFVVHPWHRPQYESTCTSAASLHEYDTTHGNDSHTPTTTTTALHIYHYASHWLFPRSVACVVHWTTTNHSSLDDELDESLQQTQPQQEDHSVSHGRSILIVAASCCQASHAWQQQQQQTQEQQSQGTTSAATSSPATPSKEAHLHVSMTWLQWMASSSGEPTTRWSRLVVLDPQVPKWATGMAQTTLIPLHCQVPYRLVHHAGTVLQQQEHEQESSASNDDVHNGEEECTRAAIAQALERDRRRRAPGETAEGTCTTTTMTTTSTSSTPTDQRESETHQTTTSVNNNDMEETDQQEESESDNKVPLHSTNTTPRQDLIQPPSILWQATCLLFPSVLYYVTIYMTKTTLPMPWLVVVFRDSLHKVLQLPPQWSLWLFVASVWYSWRWWVLAHYQVLVPANGQPSSCHNDDEDLVSSMSCQFMVQVKGSLRYISNQKEEQALAGHAAAAAARTGNAAAAVDSPTASVSMVHIVASALARVWSKHLKQQQLKVNGRPCRTLRVPWLALDHTVVDSPTSNDADEPVTVAILFPPTKITVPSSTNSTAKESHNHQDDNTKQPSFFIQPSRRVVVRNANRCSVQDIANACAHSSNDVDRTAAVDCAVVLAVDPVASSYSAPSPSSSSSSLASTTDAAGVWTAIPSTTKDTCRWSAVPGGSAQVVVVIGDVTLAEPTSSGTTAVATTAQGGDTTLGTASTTASSRTNRINGNSNNNKNATPNNNNRTNTLSTPSASLGGFMGRRQRSPVSTSSASTSSSSPSASRLPQPMVSLSVTVHGSKTERTSATAAWNIVPELQTLLQFPELCDP